MNSINENKVYLGIGQETKYPINEKGYSPDRNYPEYKFGSSNISEHNQVYEIIREGFHTLEYDNKNYGTKEWNPLGEFIKEGDTVLIKPNWVMHRNENKECPGYMDCLITHPSVVRVMIDYTLIALKGTGKVILADAPMQGCDLDLLFVNSGYLELFDFYKVQGIPIEILDLRQHRVITEKKMISDIIPINGEDQSIQIDLGKVSAHYHIKNRQYKVSDYNQDKTKTYHHENIHRYNINKNVLQADVIFNLAKPKCHKLAGITAAQKNILGIVFDKASLPHRALGAKQDGGDEYNRKSILKSLIGNLNEKQLVLIEQGKKAPAILLQCFIIFFYAIIKVFYKDKVLFGSWYGNDTIWKTIVDLNMIIRYADRNGVIKDTPQRRILTVADMVIAGQGNGPLRPVPKYLGMILIGEDLSFIDAVCAKIMGFRISKIPGLTYALKNKKLGQKGTKIIYSNHIEYHKKLFHDFLPEEAWRFEPHEYWKGHIESYSLKSNR